MSVFVTVDQLPASDRFDAVREVVSATWVPMECHSEHAAEFRSELRASGLGAMQVAVLDVMPMTVRRTPKLISQEDPDLLKMYMVCEGGTSVVEQDGQQARLSAGEFAFYDTRRPYTVAMGVQGRPTRIMTFMFAPSLLPLSPSGRRRLSAVCIPPTTGLGDLTSQFMRHLAHNIDHFSPAEAARLSAAALEVLATRLAHELDVQDWGTQEARRHALLTTIQAFIDRHLSDHLSPAEIAAAHHMSLRSIHQLFHEHGQTVAGWTRARRLEHCRRDLSDPALTTRPISAIATRWGFTSASDFSRAFRAVHGLPPSEYRRSSQPSTTAAAQTRTERMLC